MNDVENSMARLMASESIEPEPCVSLSAAMVSEMVARYVQKFGNARLQILRFGSCSNDDLRRFLNTLRITLCRKNVPLHYLWQYDPSQDAYLLFLVHYDAHTDAIFQIVHRLWSESAPLQQLNSIHVDQGNLSGINVWLFQVFSTLSADSVMMPFYQHSFGHSRSL